MTDLTHLLDSDGFPPVGAPRRVLKSLGFYGSIAKAGSSYPVGTQFASTVPCRREPTKSRLTIANARDGVIRWECPECGENGCISNWQGTACDLSAVVEPDANRRVGVHLTAAEHKLLGEILVSSQEEDAIITGGVVTNAGIWISGRIEDFDELLGSIAAEANHTNSTKRRRALHAICDRVEEMVAGSAPE